MNGREEPSKKQRLQQDREDLLAEATALVERVELDVDTFDEPIFIGFRPSGAGSIYFGPDAAYHFNSHNQLRRAYVAGLLYKAEQQRLVSLERRRPGGEVQLVRHEFSAAETAAFLKQFARLRRALLKQIDASAYQIVGQVPEQADLIARIVPWVLAVGDCPAIAASPHAV